MNFVKGYARTMTVLPPDFISTAAQFLDFIDSFYLSDNKELIDNNFDLSRFSLSQKEQYKPICARYYEFVRQNFHGLYYTYCLLENASSRRLFMNLILYRCLGPDFVRIQDGWSHSKLRSFEDRLAGYDCGESQWDIEVRGRRLRHMEGIPFDDHIYNLDTAGDCRFVFSGQYFYESPERSIQVEEGDVVIDAGSCMGEGTVKFCMIRRILLLMIRGKIKRFIITFPLMKILIYQRFLLMIWWPRIICRNLIL
jgi:hypothetical protein